MDPLFALGICKTKSFSVQGLTIYETVQFKMIGRENLGRGFRSLSLFDGCMQTVESVETVAQKGTAGIASMYANLMSAAALQNKAHKREIVAGEIIQFLPQGCLLYTSPSPRD